MLTQQLITENIPPIKLADTGARVLRWMDEFKVNHLPIVEGGEYIGLISDADVLDLPSPEEPIGNQEIEPEKLFVKENQHIFDAIKLMSEANLSVIPVLDEEGKYLGSIAMSNLIEKMATITAANEPGSILVLEMDPANYSLSEIAQIVEGNSAKVLSLFVYRDSESGMLDITLKINKTDIGGVVQTFQRYKYFIKSNFQVDQQYFDDLKSKYEAFMNFLKM
jgi:acetoin utilization protein AcuB